MEIIDIKDILLNKETEVLDFNNKEDWNILRSKGVGGSDIGAILGVNKYRGIVDVYLSKVENQKTPENNAMYFGTKLEPLIRSEFEERHIGAYKVYTTDKSLKFGILRANLDGIIYDELNKKYGVLEIKTANQFVKNEWENGVVPQSYYAQVQHYLAVTGFDFGIIAVLIGGNEYKEYYIERNQEDVEIIIDTANDFWNTYIIPKQMPFADGSDAYSEYQSEKLKKIENSLPIELDNNIDNLIKERQDYKYKIDELEKEIKLIDQKIKDELIDNNTKKGESNNYKVNLIVTNKTRINTKEFTKNFKDLIEDYKTKESLFKEPYQINYLKITEKEIN